MFPFNSSYGSGYNLCLTLVMEMKVSVYMLNLFRLERVLSIVGAINPVQLFSFSFSFFFYLIDIW
ncbi:hypothetical protein CDL12_12141 [Handroanthus impetiginosus]|uniref:Uncharacterized protein n=1 Tax=Handroanthus impetiginosus TaxID=429701 RepID=A0A2G9HCF6_9LAMI|nr:hypothetical protein CDL12_12141 [Handroanthus impetiginosus]